VVSSSAAPSSSQAVVSSSSAAPSSSILCAPHRLDVCDAVTPETTDRVLVTATGATPRGIAGLVEVGMTRAQVKANLASDPEVVLPFTTMDPSPLHAAHCATRVEVTYADRATDAGLVGFFSDDDVAVRVTTLEGFPGHSDTQLRPGTSRTTAAVAYVADLDKVSFGREFPGWVRDLWPVSGRLLTYTADGGVLGMSTFGGYAVGSQVLTIKSRRLRLGTTNIDARLPFPGDAVSGTSFSVIKTALGPPDEEGFGQIDLGNIASMAYVNLGVRFYALASGTNLNNQQVALIFLAPPFTALDSQSGVGIGNTRAEIGGALCTGPSGSQPCFIAEGAPMIIQGLTLDRYRIGVASFSGAYMGVQFVHDENCVERAAVLVINMPP
jgi:hypothetical protein